MTNVANLLNASPRVEDIEALQKIMPQCVASAAVEVGVDGMKAFFDGYKSSIDEQKLAA